MSSTKEVRELQFTRMQLVIVFILVIALGAFIFVLGVSVGKKQARLAQGLGSDAGPVTEVVRPRVKAPAAAQAEKPKPQAGEKAATTAEKKDESAPSDIQKEIASFQEREKPGQDSKATPKSKPAAKTETTALPPNKAAAAKPVPTAGPPPAGLFYIQVLAASQKDEASRLADTVRKLGFSVYILDPLAGDRTPYYRVRVGGYRTEEERSRAAERLAAALNMKPGEFYYPAR